MLVAAASPDRRFIPTMVQLALNLYLTARPEQTAFATPRLSRPEGGRKATLQNDTNFVVCYTFIIDSMLPFDSAMR